MWVTKNSQVRKSGIEYLEMSWHEVSKQDNEQVT
jgi:hypothetical protein